MNTPIKHHIFHLDRQEPSEGHVLDVFSGMDTATIEVYGTATSFELEILGQTLSDNFYSIMAVKLSDLTISSIITELDTLWQVDLNGLTKLKVELKNISGGTLNVVAKVVG